MKAKTDRKAPVRLLSLLLALLIMAAQLPGGAALAAEPETTTQSPNTLKVGNAAVSAAELAAGQIGIAKASCTVIGSYDSNPVYYLDASGNTGATSVVFTDYTADDIMMIAGVKSNAMVMDTDEAPLSAGYGKTKDAISGDANWVFDAAHPLSGLGDNLYAYWVSPYDDDDFYVIVNAYKEEAPAPAPVAPDFTASVNSEAIDAGKIEKQEGAYEYTMYEQDAQGNWNPVQRTIDLYVVTVPAGTASVDLTFSYACLAYGYDDDKNLCTEGMDEYSGGMVGKTTATRSVDKDRDGNMDYVTVQSPYDANYVSISFYAISFRYEGAGSELVDSGEFQDILWSFYADGTLKLSAKEGGKGEIPKTTADTAWGVYTDRIVKVEMAEGVKSIGLSAFKNYKALESVSIPATVNKLNGMCFDGCSSLKSVAIPEGITALPLFGFRGCTSLESVSLPSTLKSFAILAFKDVETIRHITIAEGGPGRVENGLLILNNKVEFAERGIVDLVIPEGITEIKHNVFTNFTSIKTVKFPSTLQVIGQTFKGCNGITEVRIPGSVTRGSWAFQECNGITSVYFEDQLDPENSCIAGMFQDCSNITAVRLPANLKYYGCVAHGESSIGEYELPETVVSITADLNGNKGYALYTTRGIERFVAPAGVTEVGDSAFYEANGLTYVEFKGATRVVNCFTRCPDLEMLVLPACLTEYTNNAVSANCHPKVIAFRGTQEQWEAACTDSTKKLMEEYGVKVICNYMADPDAQPLPPVIVTQPDGNVIMGKNESFTLSVAVDTEGEGEYFYAWYMENVDGVKKCISKETTCAIPSAELGEFKIHCEVKRVTAAGTGVATSNVCSVTINESGITIAGEGTAESPYLIENIDQLTYIANNNLYGKETYAGKHFKLAADITLPADWVPMGTKQALFGGSIDGGGHTLTVPAGGLPLLGYVLEAKVQNLKIYGERIEGYGLVNNMGYTYYEDGSRVVGLGITIDGVTLLSGTKTLKAGLIGSEITVNGFAGNTADYYAIIRNCVAQEGVIIGYDGTQSKIGTFAGRANIIVENCVSYATVRGVNAVGGIVGTMDNAMGECRVTGCEFYGKVEASGEYAGGIVGEGYTGGAAPNGLMPFIKDCKSAGTVTGKDRVGGIFGGDPSVTQSWGTYNITGNSFTGKVSATGGSHVGGIVGYLRSINKFCGISDNEYAADCGADKWVGGVHYIDTNYPNPTPAEGTEYYNTENGVDDSFPYGFTKDKHNRTDDPLGKDSVKFATVIGQTVEAFPTELQLSGDYKTEYITGEALDLDRMVLTVVYNDGSTKTITLDDVTVSEFDTQKVGEQELTLSYAGLTAMIKLRVKNPAGQIKVIFSVLGDSKHGSDDGNVHTLTAGNLEVWVAADTYTVDSNATVLDVLEMVLTKNNITWTNDGGNYIDFLTYNGMTLGEFDNGENSGWMYTLNGVHPELGVAEQHLRGGDVIVFHYTDDYKKETDKSETIDVNVTISNMGQVVMAQKPVTVTDRNGDGVFDMDEVLYAAHEAGFEGGAAAGYASAETEYGLSLTRLWGDTSGSFGYWCDNVSCLSLDHEVQAGANVVAFVYQDATGWSDAYTKFDAAAYTAAAGAGVRVKLEKAAYDASGNVEFSDLTGAVITAYDSDFKALNASEYTVTEGEGGEYTVTFTKAGSYYLVASGNGVLTVPAVSRLTVEPGQNVPDAGDPILWIAALPVLAMAAVVVLFKRKSKI